MIENIWNPQKKSSQNNYQKKERKKLIKKQSLKTFKKHPKKECKPKYITRKHIAESPGSCKLVKKSYLINKLEDCRIKPKNDEKIIFTTKKYTTKGISCKISQPNWNEKNHRKSNVNLICLN